jgi:hypothetical protein
MKMVLPFSMELFPGNPVGGLHKGVYLFRAEVQAQEEMGFLSADSFKVSAPMEHISHPG